MTKTVPHKTFWCRNHKNVQITYLWLQELGNLSIPICTGAAVSS